MQFTKNTGYHETITRFYVHRIRSFLDNADAGRDADTLADERITRHGDKNLRLRYFSRGSLFSPTARLSWAELDL
jgi:hypothetical protein